MQFRANNKLAIFELGFTTTARIFTRVIEVKVAEILEIVDMKQASVLLLRAKEDLFEAGDVMTG